MPRERGMDMEQAVPAIERYKADPRLETLYQIVEESGSNSEAINQFFKDYVEHQKQLAAEGKFSEDVNASILENPEEAAKKNIRFILTEIGSSPDGKLNDKQKEIMEGWKEAIPGL